MQRIRKSNCRPDTSLSTVDGSDDEVFVGDVVVLEKDLNALASVSVADAPWSKFGVPMPTYRVEQVFQNGKIKLRQLHRDGSLGYAFNQAPRQISLWRKG